MYIFELIQDIKERCIDLFSSQVVKHLGRMRVPKNLDLQSPDGARLKKAAPRESMAVSNNTLDENSMELSIREVKEIKKLTTLPKKL